MKKIITCLAALLLTLTGCSALAQSVTVTFYDMGKADAALVTTETGARILIDAGTNKGGKKLAERFAGEGIDRIDLMIITHFDKDHVGGADKILENIEVARVLEPDYDKDSKQYRQYREALEQVDAVYQEHLYDMKMMVNYAGRTDWLDYKPQEKLLVQNTVLLVGLLYKMCKLQLVIPATEEGKLNSVDSYGAANCRRDAKMVLRKVAESEG